MEKLKKLGNYIGSGSLKRELLVLYLRLLATLTGLLLLI